MENTYDRLQALTKGQIALIHEKSVELLESYIRQLDSKTADKVRPSVLLDYELKVRQSTAQCPTGRR